MENFGTRGVIDMLRRDYMKISVIMILLIMVISVGCNKDISNKNNKVAYISSNPDSNYNKTFEDLNLGKIFDFNLKLSNAEESWVEMWVEGYSNGKMIETPLIGISMGEFLNRVEEGNIGFGIMNPNSEEMQIFSYGLGASTKPHLIDNDFFIKDGISAWDIAIDNNRVELEYGEEMLLAVYRQAEKQIRTYDYKNLDSINKMINEDKVVFLFKIKVEEIEKKD